MGHAPCALEDDPPEFSFGSIEGDGPASVPSYPWGDFFAPTGGFRA